MWQRALSYRFTIIAYRIGELVEVLIIITMWSAIYTHQSSIAGYTLNQMLSYLILGNLINVITRNFLTDYVSREIREGTLSLLLIKPINYLRFAFIREIGRVSVISGMSIITQIIVLLFFRHLFTFNQDIRIWVIIIIMTFLAFLLELLKAFLIAMITFWTDEVSGVYTIIGRLEKFFSGGYFPLNLLPTLFVSISFCLPFAYSFYIPTQLYLGKMSLTQGLQGLAVQAIWIALLYGLIKIVWRKGLRKYEGVGI
jgi:ABC-2 type transport system permease protein